MGKSEDGTTIYGYDASDEQQVTPPANILYMEDLNEHFNRVFPNRETGVFHELISDIVHIDVNIMEATPDEPYRVLYTNGMSDLPLTLPQEIREEYKHLERAEPDDVFAGGLAAYAGGFRGGGELLADPADEDACPIPAYVSDMAWIRPYDPQHGGLRALCG